MYKIILVPLDGSERAEAVLPHVEGLALNFQAEVILMRVIEPVFVYTDVHGYIRDETLEEQQREALLTRAETYLKAQQGEFQEKNIPTKTHVEEGPVVGSIINVAKREEVDLIAMASHGRTGLAHVFYGSVAAGVLHRVDRPLLLVRAV
jgi:nucleotide-binding universal stress UspA family protein